MIYSNLLLLFLFPILTDNHVEDDNHSKKTRSVAKDGKGEMSLHETNQSNKRKSHQIFSSSSSSSSSPPSNEHDSFYNSNPLFSSHPTVYSTQPSPPLSSPPSLSLLPSPSKHASTTSLLPSKSENMKRNSYESNYNRRNLDTKSRSNSSSSVSRHNKESTYKGRSCTDKSTDSSRSVVRTPTTSTSMFRGRSSTTPRPASASASTPSSSYSSSTTASQLKAHHARPSTSSSKLSSSLSLEIGKNKQLPSRIIPLSGSSDGIPPRPPQSSLTPSLAPASAPVPAPVPPPIPVRRSSAPPSSISYLRNREHSFMFPSTEERMNRRNRSGKGSGMDGGRDDLEMYLQVRSTPCPVLYHPLLHALYFSLMHCFPSSVYFSRTHSLLLSRLKRITQVVKETKEKKKREEKMEEREEEEEEEEMMIHPSKKLMDSALHGIRSLPLDLMTPSTQATTAHREHTGDHTHRRDVRVPLGPA